MMCFALILLTKPISQCTIFVFIQCIILAYSWMIHSYIKTVDKINTVIADTTVVIVSMAVLSMPEQDYSDYNELTNERKGMVF